MPKPTVRSRRLVPDYSWSIEISAKEIWNSSRRDNFIVGARVANIILYHTHFAPCFVVMALLAIYSRR